MEELYSNKYRKVMQNICGIEICQYVKFINKRTKNGII